MSRRSSLFGLAIVLGLLGACSASDAAKTFDNTPAGNGGSAGMGQGPATGTGTGGDMSVGVGGSTGPGMGPCNAGPNDDYDKDGFTIAQGDCNDCDPNVNPGAIEVVITQPQGDGGVPPPADEDCDGTKDNPPGPCDDGLTLTDPDPFDGAKAIELCQKATAMDKKWGVLDAKYVRADGTPTPANAQVGIQANFGPNVNVQGGKNMLMLSSGAARLPGQAGECDTYMCDNGLIGTAPPGFPQDVPNCPGSPDINDDIGLELKIRAPTNATGYKFDFKFQSFEFPEYVCTDFNDQFIALVNPAPMGSINGNISFDSKNNPVSVNIAFFDVCDPAGKPRFAENCLLFGSGMCPNPPNPYCPSGPAQLAGTGFDGSWDDGSGDGDAGGTSWLETQAPVTGGQEFTIRFAIWDTGDGIYDSTVLVDNFQWIASGGSVSIGTNPVPTPK